MDSYQGSKSTSFDKFSNICIQRQRSKITFLGQKQKYFIFCIDVLTWIRIWIQYFTIVTILCTRKPYNKIQRFVLGRLQREIFEKNSFLSRFVCVWFQSLQKLLNWAHTNKCFSKNLNGGFLSWFRIVWKRCKYIMQKIFIHFRSGRLYFVMKGGNRYTLIDSNLTEKGNMFCSFPRK